MHGRSRFLTVMITLGLAFMYIPLILLVIYSFNNSKLVPVWGGWSTRWYKVLFESPDVWNAVSVTAAAARKPQLIYDGSQGSMNWKIQR